VQAYVAANIAASGEAGGFRDIPPASQWRLSKEAAYVHLTANETIHGVEFRPEGGPLPDTAGVPLFADFSSSIASEPLDVSRYGLIYAGAQKTLGPVGVTVVIVRRDLLGRAGEPRADIFNYASHAQAGSMLNTPPSYNWYLAGLVFKWMLAEGGVDEFARRSAEKSRLLYAAIDGSGGFYRNEVASNVRSRMNVPFFLHDEALTAAFLAQAKEAGLLALKGHRVLGGIRASIYNAMPVEGVQALVGFMHDFRKRHG
jgi:phosphoserine aminotransferase